MQQPWFRWWYWLFKNIPCGSRVWLAENHNQIVGQYPLILLDLKVGNTTVKASQNLDLSTHPDYRYQGVFSALERKALDELTKDAIHITIGLSSEASHPGHIKSGWFDVATGRRVFRVFKWENILKKWISHKLFLKHCASICNTLNKLLFRASRTPVIKGLTIAQVSCFDERINEFWTRVSSQFPIMVVRSKDYLNWRYTVPDVSYSIYIAEKAEAVCGYLVLRYVQRENRKVAFICDFLVESEEAAQCLLSTATEHCQRDGVDYMYWYGIANKAYLSTFRKRGFFSIPFRKEGKFIVYSSSPNIPKEFLANPINWLFPMIPCNM